MSEIDPDDFPDNVKLFTLERREKHFKSDFPKLITMEDLNEPLKPLVFLNERFDNLCLEKHDHLRSSEDCYLFFLESCQNQEFSPCSQILSKDNLMASVPIIDHLTTVLGYTELECIIGGSWYCW